MVQGFRLVEKGHTTARKETNLMGLTNPVNTASFANHTLNVKKKISLQMMTEYMGQTAELSKKSEINTFP